MSKKEKEIVSLEELATKSEKKATKKKSTVPVIETDTEMEIKVELKELADSMFRTKTETDEETHANNPFVNKEELIAPLKMDNRLRKMFKELFKTVGESFDSNSLEAELIREAIKFIGKKESTLNNSKRSQLNLMLMNFVDSFESLKDEKGGISEEEYTLFESIAKVTIRSLVDPSATLGEIDSLTESLKDVYSEDEIVSLKDILETELGRITSKNAVIPKSSYQYYTTRDREVKLSPFEIYEKYPLKYPC